MWNFFLKTWILALVFSLHKKFVFINLLAFKRRKKTISHYINNIMCKRNTTLKRIILSFGTWRSRIWNDQQNMTNRVIYREWWTMRPTNLYWLYWAKAHLCKGKINHKSQLSYLVATVLDVAIELIGLRPVYYSLFSFSVQLEVWSLDPSPTAIEMGS